MKERYWLRVGELEWQEATREQFIRAERSAGFYPKGGGDGLATGGFFSGGVEGTITCGEITKEKYGHDPALLRAVEKSRKK